MNDIPANATETPTVSEAPPPAETELDTTYTDAQRYIQEVANNLEREYLYVLPRDETTTSADVIAAIIAFNNEGMMMNLTRAWHAGILFVPEGATTPDVIPPLLDGLEDGEKSYFVPGAYEFTIICQMIDPSFFFPFWNADITTPEHYISAHNAFVEYWQSKQGRSSAAGDTVANEVKNAIARTKTAVVTTLEGGGELPPGVHEATVIDVVEGVGPTGTAQLEMTVDVAPAPLSPDTPPAPAPGTYKEACALHKQQVASGWAAIETFRAAHKQAMEDYKVAHLAMMVEYKELKEDKPVKGDFQ